MIADKYINFFLDGNFGKNPVALEIPIDRTHPELVPFLRERGLNIAGAAAGADQIMVSEDSILTPVVSPENMKTLYKTIELLVSEFNNTHYNSKIMLGYPHIIDADNIIPSKLPNANWPERLDYVDKMLKEISTQEKDNLRDNMFDITNQFGAEIQKQQAQNQLPQDIIFSGGTISDPYSVATGQSDRFFRYATSDYWYAVGYSNLDRIKAQNGYSLVSKGSIKYGFVFVYKQKPDDKQLFFTNTGIEFRSDAAYKQDTDETMVNRFNNECVGQYMFFAAPVPSKPGTYKYGFVKIPQNDEKWEKFKEFSKTDNAPLNPAKNKRLDAWAIGKNTEPVLPLIKPMPMDKFYESCKQDIEKDKQSRINTLNKIKLEIQQLSESTLKTFTDFNNVLDGITAPKYNETNYDAQLVYLSDAEKRISDIKYKLAQESKQIQDKLQHLQTDIAQFDNVKDIQSQTASVTDALTKTKKNFLYNSDLINQKIDKKYISVWRSNITDKKRKFITNFIGEDEPVAFTYANTDKEIMQNLDTDTKRQILADVYTNLHNTKRDIRLKYLAKAALFVYYCSTPEQQVELFNDLYKIRKDKDIANIRKLLKETNTELVSDGFALLPEISELVKNDILFIKHSQKGQDIIANKKILFEQATRKLQQMISNTMQQQFALNKNVFAKQ